jgi:hypothetical protein
VTVPFVRKGWVTDSPPRGRGRFRGESGLSADRAEAEREALADAIRRLREAAGVARERGRPRDDIIGRRHLRDRYVEVVARPGGTFYKGFALLEAGDSDLARLAREGRSAARREAAGRAFRLGGVIGIVSMLLCGYAVANAATRGYLRTPLRLAAMVLSAAGVWLLLMGR